MLKQFIFNPIKHNNIIIIGKSVNTNQLVQTNINFKSKQYENSVIILKPGDVKNNVLQDINKCNTIHLIKNVKTNNDILLNLLDANNTSTVNGLNYEPTIFGSFIATMECPISFQSRIRNATDCVYIFTRDLEVSQCISIFNNYYNTTKEDVDIFTKIITEYNCIVFDIYPEKINQSYKKPQSIYDYVKYYEF